MLQTISTWLTKKEESSKGKSSKQFDDPLNGVPVENVVTTCYLVYMFVGINEADGRLTRWIRNFINDDSTTAISKHYPQTRELVRALNTMSDKAGTMESDVNKMLRVLTTRFDEAKDDSVGGWRHPQVQPIVLDAVGPNFESTLHLGNSFLAT